MASKFFLQLLILVEFVILVIFGINFHTFLQAISFNSLLAKTAKRNCYQIFARECNLNHGHKWLSYQNHNKVKTDLNFVIVIIFLHTRTHIMPSFVLFVLLIICYMHPKFTSSLKLSKGTTEISIRSEHDSSAKGSDVKSISF